MFNLDLFHIFFSESLTVGIQFKSNNVSQISVIHNKFCQLSWGYQVLTEERKIYKLLEKSCGEMLPKLEIFDEFGVSNGE